MPYRPPLVPHETFVADPVDLPVRPPGQQGLAAITRAEVVTVDGGAVTFKALTADGESLLAEVSVAGEGVVRVRLSQDPDAHSRSAQIMTLVTPGQDPSATVSVADGRVLLRTGPLIAEVSLEPWHIRFTDPTGRLLVAENAGEADVTGRIRTLPFGRSTVDGVVVAYHETFTAGPDEHFVGLGEKFTGFDKRGQHALMWNYDAFGAESDRSYKNVPFYLSSRGYGVVVDSGMATEFDLCQSTHTCVQIVVPDDLIDYYLIAGPTPAEVLDRFDRLTSRPLLPPKWAFGTWISSGFFADSQESVLDRARTIRDRAIPCDVLHLDCFWQVAEHWSDLQWDTANFPDPEGMFETLAGLGFRVCLWINSYLSRDSPLFPEAAQRGYLLRRADGSAYVADVWHGYQPPCGIVDFTNPEATAWYAGLLRPLLRQGAAVFKTDFAEGVPADAVAYNGMSGAELHNVYSLLFNDAAAAVTQEVAGHGLVWARSSFLGGQRHSAQWSGDSNASYTAMASTLRAGLSYGLSGVPFWSHDVGGFSGRPTPDLYARWAQFGAFSPLVRFHGTTSRLPWDFPAEASDAAVEALRLRYRFMPYLYAAAVDSARTGVPMMRALLVEHPDDPAAWLADLEYLIGSDLLVAPISDPEGVRHVYLPRGSWVDWWSGEAYEGPGHIRISQPLHRLPLFVRHASLIATAPAAVTVGDAPFEALTLLSIGGTDASTVLRDVDGDTVVAAARTGDRLEVTTAGPARVRAVAFPFAAGTPTEVSLNGEVTAWSTVDGVRTASLE
jgi:alpha-D-xyloside xylohydrolase